MIALDLGDVVRLVLTNGLPIAASARLSREILMSTFAVVLTSDHGAGSRSH